MAYSKKDKERAFTAFLQCRTIEGTSTVCGIPAVTLRKWRTSDKWLARLEMEKQNIADDPFEKNDALEKFVDGFNIASEDAEVLRQIKLVEGVCLACMREDVPIEQIHLQPKSFKEATEVLSRCWKAREELLHRDKKATINISGGIQKMDFVTQGANANTANSGQEVVSRQAPYRQCDD